MKKIIVVLFIVIVFVTLNEKSLISKENEYGPAAMTVKIFCELDGMGIRLSSHTWKYIKAVVNWEDEPGWDFLYLIDRYEIVGEEYSGAKAIVKVRYHVVGAIEGYEKKASEFEYREETYKLVNNNGWKIYVDDNEIPVNPYTYVETSENTEE